jgi:hypothetical protein
MKTDKYEKELRNEEEKRTKKKRKKERKRKNLHSTHIKSI